MTHSYTIKSGDNLWNICKRQFNLSNNADIAKKVNEVAKANGISNPNLIFAGKKIELSDATDTLERNTNPTQGENTTPTTQVTTEQAQNYEKWAFDKENIEKTYQYAISENQQGKPPVEDFDFLGTDMTKVPSEQKAQTYTSGLLKFSQSNILNANTDEDTSTLTFEEFYAKEKKDAESFGLDTPSEEVIRTIFNNLDIDGNKKIDTKELSTTFAFMDISKGTDENSGKINGKIDHESIVFTNFAHEKAGQKLREMFKFLYPNEQK